MRGGIDSSAVVALVVSTGMTAAVATPMAVAAVDARNEPAVVEEVISTDDDRFPDPVVFDDSELAVVLPTAAPAPTTEPAEPTAAPAPTASPTEVVLSPDFPPLPTPAPTDVPADPTAVPPTQGPPTQGPPTVTPQTPTLPPTPTPSPTEIPATPTPVQPTMPPIQTATPEPTPTRHPNVTPTPTPTPSVPTPTSTATPTPTTVPPTPTATPTPTTPPRTPVPTPTTIPSTPTPSPQPPPPTPTSSPDPALTNLGVALNGSSLFTAGQAASVTIAVSNTGTENGRDVNVALNAGQGAISDVRGAGWFCSPQAPGSWNCFRNTVPVGTSLLTMSLVPHAEGSLAITASVSSSGTDSSPGNNAGTWAFPVSAGEGPR